MLPPSPVRCLAPCQRFWPVVLLALTLASGATAQASEPQFIAVTAGAVHAPAPLVGIDKDGGVRLGGPTPRHIAGEDLVELRSANRSAPLFPRRHFVLLANGDWLPLDPAGRIAIADERVHLDLAPPLRGKDGAGFVLSQSALALLALEAPEPDDDPVETWANLRKLRQSDDLLVLRDGTRVEGTLARIEKRVHFLLAQRPVDFPLEQTSALVLSSDLRARPRLKKPHAHVTLSCGARLTLAHLQFDVATKRLAGVSPYGAALEFPLDQLANLEHRSDGVVALSELTPAAWRHTPFLDVVHPLTRDLTRAGRPLEIGGAGHRHGLAMPCRGEAVYDLDGKFRWFEVSLGVYPADGQGSSRFEVLVDGKPVVLGKASERLARDAPLAVRIDVRNTKTLTLISAHGRRGNVQSEAIWAGARLIR